MKSTLRFGRLVRDYLFLCLILVAACSNDESPTSNPAPPQLSVSIDTTVYYSTPEDSLTIEASIAGNPSDAQWYCSFGEGGTPIQLQPSGNRLIAKHLYAAKGGYSLRIWGEANGTALCADTATINVQDYVRPSEANTVKITIENGVFLFAGVSETDRPDSVRSRVQNSIKIIAQSYDKSNNLVRFPSYKHQVITFNCSYYKDDPFRISTDADYIGEIVFSADGSSINRLTLNTNITTSESYSSALELIDVFLESIPRKDVENTSRQRAVYFLESQFSPSIFGGLKITQFYGACVEREKWVLLSYTPNPKYRITVEFTKQ